VNKKVKTKWLKALRSGEYKQTTSALRDDRGYCCMGVLCDVHAKEFNRKWNKDEGYSYFQSCVVLPSEVIKWAELNYSDPMVGDRSLSYYNDTEGNNFDEIADIIKETL